MSWDRSELVRRIEDERREREAEKARLHELEHVKIVRKWRSHGMRVKLPKVGLRVKPPRAGTMICDIYLSFGAHGQSSRLVADALGVKIALVCSAVAKLRERGMLTLKSTRATTKYYCYAQTLTGIEAFKKQQQQQEWRAV